MFDTETVGPYSEIEVGGRVGVGGHGAHVPPVTTPLIVTIILFHYSFYLASPFVFLIKYTLKTEFGKDVLKLSV